MVEYDLKRYLKIFRCKRPLQFAPCSACNVVCEALDVPRRGVLVLAWERCGMVFQLGVIKRLELAKLKAKAIGVIPENFNRVCSFIEPVGVTRDAEHRQSITSHLQSQANPGLTQIAKVSQDSCLRA